MEKDYYKISGVERDATETAFRQAAPQTDVSLADVLLSLHYLSPTAEKTKKAIADALGFEWETYVEPVVTNKPQNIALDDVPGGVKVSEAPTGESQSSPSAEEPEDEAPEDVITLTPQEETETASSEIFSADALATVDPLPPTSVERHFKKPPFTPLFDEKWFRAIMSLILATPTPTSEVDFKLLEARLVNLAPIRELPKLYRNSLQKGVQIMLDVSEAMQPFRRDADELAASLNGLLDKSRMKILKYELKTAPEKRMVRHNRGAEILQPETPVLMVTNFHGSNRQRLHRIESHDPLVDFFEELKNKKCPVAALVPLPAELFPEDLNNYVACAYSWDRSTSPQMVSRIKRK